MSKVWAWLNKGWLAVGMWLFYRAKEVDHKELQRLEYLNALSAGYKDTEVVLTLTPDVAKKIDIIKEMAGLEHRHEVFQQAMTVYDWFLCMVLIDGQKIWVGESIEDSVEFDLFVEEEREDNEQQ